MGGTLTANQEIIVGVDRSVEAFVRPVARNSETGSTFTALPDDQFAARQDKTGFYGGISKRDASSSMLAFRLVWSS